MKFHKLMSRTVMATALLGATIGIGFSGANASAANQTYTNNGYNESFPQKPDSSNQQTLDNDVYKGNSGNTNGKESIHINTNSLTLDSVPTLNFNGDTNGSVNKLSLTNASEGNNGLLEVTDHRTIDNNSNISANNWKLSATMGAVKPINGTNSDTDVNNNVWELILNNSSATNSTTSNMSTSNTLYNDGSNSNNNGNNVIMSNDSSHNGYGINKINYNTDNAANLIIPNVAPGDYEGSVNWQLTTSVDENSNNTNNY